MAAGLGIDRNLVLDYGRAGAWRLNFKNQTYPSNPGVNPGLIRTKTKKIPLDPQFKPTVQCTVGSQVETQIVVADLTTHTISAGQGLISARLTP